MRATFVGCRWEHDHVAGWQVESDDKHLVSRFGCGTLNKGEQVELVELVELEERTGRALSYYL